MSHKNPPTGISGKGGSEYEVEFRSIGQILQRDAEQIAQRWFERATKEQVRASPDEREKAMNQLLKMLQSLGRRLEEQSSNAFEAATEIALHHGRQRSRLGWDSTHVVRDYEILHGATLEHLGATLSERLTYRQAMIIAAVMDRATGSAVHAFSERTNRQLESQVKRQQRELRQLLLDVTEAEHGERQRIAPAPHDDFQQLLVAARMRLDTIRGSPAANPAALEELQGLLNNVLEASRDLSRDLHPARLETISLPTALEALAQSFQERHNLEVLFDLQLPKEANPGALPLRRLIYDGVRELLFNVVKHGQTDKAWVRVSEVQPAVWRFDIEDHGVGFTRRNMDEPASPTGLGLSSLRHRIEQMGGRVEIESEPGQGTRISLVVPMEEPEAAD